MKSPNLKKLPLWIYAAVLTGLLSSFFLLHRNHPVPLPQKTPSSSTKTPPLTVQTSPKTPAHPSNTGIPTPQTAVPAQPSAPPLAQVLAAPDSRWPFAPILHEFESPLDPFGVVERTRILRPDDLPWPVRVVERFHRDHSSPATAWSRLSRHEFNAIRFSAKLAPDASPADLVAAAEPLNLRVSRPLTRLGHYELVAPESLAPDLPILISMLDAASVTDYAEPSAIVHTFSTPNDPRLLDGSLWGLQNTGQNDGSPDADIDAPEGWAIRTSAPNIIVGVVDTGVRATHQDIAANLWSNPSEIVGNGIDDDANGWVDDRHGIDATNNDGDPTDDNGHGTHVAGTIAAVGNNATGVVGVAWDARIMGLKFLSASGSGDTNDAVACITYATSKQARILNNSWGGNYSLNTLQDAIQAADAAGVVFVVAAGNSTLDNNTSDVFPANYRLPNVLSVAATDRRDELATFSNYGSATVHLAAPGVTIRSLGHTSDSEYKDLSGTSMASPHVAGAAALLAAEFPGESPRQLINRLLRGGDPIPAAASTTASGRRLNLYGSLTTSTHRPFHDDFAESRLVVGSAIALESWTTGATSEPGEPAHVDGHPAGPSVWWSWTAPNTGVAVFSTENTAFDTLAAAYTGTALGNLVRIISNDDSSVGGTTGSRLTFTAQAGTTYHFAVSGKAAATGLVRAFLSGPPPNDDLANATLMTGGNVSGTNINATKEPGEPNHASLPGGYSVWWKFTPATAGKLAAATHGTAFDTLLAVYRTQSATPTFGDLQLVGANNNSDESRTTSRVAFQTELGWTYYFAIDTASGLTGAVTLSVSTPPPNDDFADRTPVLGLDYPLVRTGHNTQASRELGEPTHHGTAFGRSLWWSWTAPASRRYEIRTEGSYASTVLAVYTGNAVNTLSLIASDQASGGSNNSIVTFNAVAGTTYQIAIDDTGFNHGSVQLVLEESLLGPNDHWQNAITLSGQSDSDTQGNAGATRQAGEPGNESGDWSNTIWWEWTAPVTGAYAVHTAGSDFATMLRVTTGSAVNALTTVATDEFQRGPDKSSHVVIQASAGTTYYFSVSGLELQSGLATINVAPWTPHANDDFANAEVLSAPVFRHLRPNYGATKEAGEPNPQGYAGGASIWFQWTPSTSQGGRAVASTYGSGFPTVIAVYTGTALNNLVPVTNLMPEDHHYGATEIVWNAQVGTTYYVLLDVPGTGGALTGGDLALTLGPVRANDNFANATLLTGTTVQDITHNFGATKEAGEPNHKSNSAGGKSLWWTWTCPTTGVYQVDTIGSRSPLVTEGTVQNFLAVYTGSAVHALTLFGRGVAIGVNPEFYNQKLVATFTAGTTYHIAVDGNNFWELYGGPAYDTTALGITLNITPFPVAENNHFANAIHLEGESPRVASSTVGASKETGEPNHGGMTGGRSLWWSWTAPETATYYAHVGELYDDFRSTDTAVAIYTGSAVNALTLIASDQGSAQNGHSLAGFNAVAGTTYHIAVDSASSATSGNVVLSLRKAPDHDHFAQARQMTGYSWIDESHNIGATREANEPILTTWYQGYPGTPQNRRTVWWSWTAPVSGPVGIETLGSQLYNTVAVFTGNDLANLTEIAKHIALDPLNHAQGQTRDYRGTARVAFNAVAGTTYRITVTGQGWTGDSAGSIRLALTGPDTPPTPPTAPSDLQATATSPATVALSWSDNSGNETGFTLERASSPSGPWSTVANPAANATTHTDTGLAPATSYSYRLKAVNAGGESAYTPVATTTTPAGPLAYDGFNAADYPNVNVGLGGLAPLRPGWASEAWSSPNGAPLLRSGGLAYTHGSRALSQESAGRVEAPNNGRSGRYLNTAADGPFAALRDNTTGRLGQDGSTLYFSFLMRINAYGYNAFELHNGGVSDSQRVFQLGRVEGTSSTQFKLRRVDNSTVRQEASLGTLDTGINLFVVKIEFGAGTTAGNERITVWRNPDLASEGASAPTALLTNVNTFVFDRLSFASFAGGGAGGNTDYDEFRFGSNWDSVTPHTGGGVPSAPSSLTALATSSTSIQLSWTDASTDETGFKLERSPDGSTGWTLLVTKAANATTHTDTGLAPGTSYFYRVKATNADGDSAPSNTAAATTWSNLEQWRINNSLPSDLTLDSDGDGLSNLLEYALDLAPNAPSVGPSPSLTSSLPYSLQLSFLRARPELTYEVLASSDLIGWQVLTTNPGSVSTSTPVVVQDPLPISEAPRRFLRLRVTAP